MLKELRFVMGAVAKKDFVAAMTHFEIKDGHVRSYNGTLALSTPVPIGIDCKPKAQALVTAIGKCEETITLTLTTPTKLRVVSGSFSCYVDCIDEPTPHVVPEGEDFHIDGELLLTCFKKLEAFIGDDASRPWTNGVLLKGESAYATNNAMLVQFWLGLTTPHTVNIPRNAIREIIRINEPPTHCQFTRDSITFHFSGERWVRSQLLATEWPDVDKILDREADPVPMDDRIYAGIEVLKNFSENGTIYFTDEAMRTHLAEGEGASYNLPDFVHRGAYRFEMLNKLKGVATLVDFSAYPSPISFRGERLRGVFTGMKM